MKIEDIQTVIELENQLEEGKRQLKFLSEFNRFEPIYLTSNGFYVRVLDNIALEVAEKVRDSILSKIEEIKKKIENL